MKKCPGCGTEIDTDQIFCQYCGTRLEEKIQEDAEPEPANQDEKNSAEPPQAQEEASVSAPKRPGKKWGVLLGISIGVGVLALLFALLEWNEAERYRRQYRSVYYDYSRLEERNSDLAEQVDFMNQYIGIIDGDSDDNLYHTYDCESWDWDGEWSILAYNIDTAEKHGYEPCPECH